MKKTLFIIIATFFITINFTLAQTKPVFDTALAQKLGADEYGMKQYAIKAGVFAVELHPFYCSAALMEVNAIHQKIEKKSVAD